MLFSQDSEVKTGSEESGAGENTENPPQPGETQIKQEVSAADVSGKTIIAVGGAKGGVGKSALAANLAVGLSLLGQEVELNRSQRPGTIFWIGKQIHSRQL